MRNETKRCGCRVFAAIAPAFGRHARIPYESMGAAALRALLVLPGVSDHPAVAAALGAALDTGPAWPQVGLQLVFLPLPSPTVLQSAIAGQAAERSTFAFSTIKPCHILLVTLGCVVTALSLLLSVKREEYFSTCNEMNSHRQFNLINVQPLRRNGFACSLVPGAHSYCAFRF